MRFLKWLADYERPTGYYFIYGVAFQVYAFFKNLIAGGAKANDDALYTLDNDLSKTPDDTRLAQDVTLRIREENILV